jgi:hypothetical protein
MTKADRERLISEYITRVEVRPSRVKLAKVMAEYLRDRIAQAPEELKRREELLRLLNEFGRKETDRERGG